MCCGLVMRALVPGTTVLLSMCLLGMSYSWRKKMALLPIAAGVCIACAGDTSCTVFGAIVTATAVIFAAVKAVLSSKVRNDEIVPKIARARDS